MSRSITFFRNDDAAHSQCDRIAPTRSRSARTKISRLRSPGYLDPSSNDPDALYSAIAMALQDGFAKDVVKAVRRLSEIDPIHSRAVTVYGIALRHRSENPSEHSLEQAEEVSDERAVHFTSL